MVRFACPRTAAAVLFCSIGFWTPASAQESSPQSPAEFVDSVALQAAPPSSLLSAASEIRIEPRRPAALIPLYVSFSTLQVLDTHSTSRALSAGAVEANPAMKPFTSNTTGMLAIKAAATTGLIYASEKMWKRNRTAAIVFMVAANSAMVWVVQHNYRAVN
jgi:hypothetical protein